MSTPINPSSLMIYKIVRDYEHEGKTIHTLDELMHFANRSLRFAKEICGESFWILETDCIKEDLLKICDLTDSICELNIEKYRNGGKYFAKTKIGLMPYAWHKGAIMVFKEAEEFKSNNPNVSSVIVNYPNGDKMVSAVVWGCGKIVVGEEDITSK